MQKMKFSVEVVHAGDMERDAADVIKILDQALEHKFKGRRACWDIYFVPENAPLFNLKPVDMDPRTKFVLDHWADSKTRSTENTTEQGGNK